MRKTLLVYILMLISTHLSAQFSYSIFDKLTTPKSCPGEYASALLKMKDSDEDTILVQFIGSNMEDLVIYKDSNRIRRGESFVHVNSNRNAQTLVEFVIESGKPNPYLVLAHNMYGRTNIDTIPIILAYHFISTNNSIIQISDACVDSVTIAFPYSGTQTDVVLFEFDNGDYQKRFGFTYYCCHFGNEVRFSKSAINKYKYGITACYSSYKEYEFVLK